VYQWGLPVDVQPLIHSIEGLCGGEFDAVLFTTGVQLDHLLQVAEELGKREQVVEKLRQAFLASIGPTCSETLHLNGLTPDLEPSHPKMGILVREAALKYAQKHAG
jgi:uroporphyrinogen-III synthase